MQVTSRSHDKYAAPILYLCPPTIPWPLLLNRTDPASLLFISPAGAFSADQLPDSPCPSGLRTSVKLMEPSTPPPHSIVASSSSGHHTFSVTAVLTHNRAGRSLGPVLFLCLNSLVLWRDPCSLGKIHCCLLSFLFNIL